MATEFTLNEGCWTIGSVELEDAVATLRKGLVPTKSLKRVLV
jgi:hypothetical protein